VKSPIPGLNPDYALNHELNELTRIKIIPDYALAYELHELTPIKIIKCTGFYLDENGF